MKKRITIMLIASIFLSIVTTNIFANKRTIPFKILKGYTIKKYAINPKNNKWMILYAKYDSQPKVYYDNGDVVLITRGYKNFIVNRIK